MSNDNSLRIERIIDAPADAVFGAWTTEEAMEQWYAEGDDPVVNVVELDVRVGGRYHVEWGPRGAEPYVETGVYIEIDRPHRLVMRETLRGPGVDGWEDTTVTVEFEDVEGKTRLVLEHVGFPSTEARDGARGGWPGFIDRLERYVTH
ncbi:MAG TPA: SRPBCC domain-containing protein [Acidimicrobiia bacterium]|nr:SRPBCC domain-containing protein [Acidimicrobiia bacterium]